MFQYRQSLTRMAVASAMALGALIAAPFSQAEAADRVGIMIMPLDHDPDSIPRDSRVTQRIIDEIATQLQIKDFEVFDETALTVATHQQGRIRRSDAELIQVARTVRDHRIDVIVPFTTYARVDRNDATNLLDIRIAGRLLQVHDGRRLGNWNETLVRGQTLPYRCWPSGQATPYRDCVLEAVQGYAAQVGTAMADILADRLVYLEERDSVAGPQDGATARIESYVVEFQGFDDRDIDEIEEHLVYTFSGYERHRPINAQNKYWKIRYWSTARQAKLHRNLRQLMTVMDLDATVNLDAQGFVVRNKNIRRVRRSPNVDQYQW